VKVATSTCVCESASPAAFADSIRAAVPRAAALLCSAFQRAAS
jgi:hypothetical protein